MVGFLIKHCSLADVKLVIYVNRLTQSALGHRPHGLRLHAFREPDYSQLSLVAESTGMSIFLETQYTGQKMLTYICDV